MQLPTKGFVQLKHKAIKQALDYQYTSGEIDAIIKRKKQFRDTMQRKYFGDGIHSSFFFKVPQSMKFREKLIHGPRFR